MLTTVIILAISSTLGWFVALWAMRQLAVAKHDLANQTLLTAQAQADAGKTRAESALIERARKRSQDVINIMQKAVAELEGDLDACNDPSVVRDRLRRVLASPLKRADDGAHPTDAGTTASMRREPAAAAGTHSDLGPGVGVP